MVTCLDVIHPVAKREEASVCDKIHKISDTFNTKSALFETKIEFSVTLREHLRTHETFTVDLIIRDLLRNYHQFSRQSYVVAIY